MAILQIFHLDLFWIDFTLVHSLSWSSKAKLNRKIYSKLIKFSHFSFISNCNIVKNVVFFTLHKNGRNFIGLGENFIGLLSSSSLSLPKLFIKVNSIQTWRNLELHLVCFSLVFKTTIKASKAKSIQHKTELAKLDGKEIKKLNFLNSNRKHTYFLKRC